MVETMPNKEKALLHILRHLNGKGVEEVADHILALFNAPQRWKPEDQQEVMIDIRQKRLTALDTERVVQQAKAKRQGTKTRGAPLGQRLRYHRLAGQPQVVAPLAPPGHCQAQKPGLLQVGVGRTAPALAAAPAVPEVGFSHAARRARALVSA